MHLNKERLVSIILSPMYMVLDKIVKRKISKKKNKKILLIFLGEIGDYILFRNFIQEIKKDLKYKNYSITLCGNPLWKSISENLDKNYIDNFIWINRKNFLINLFYRFNKLRDINEGLFEIALQPAYGRFFSTDSIIKVSNSIDKIGSKGNPKSMFTWQKKISDSYYTKLFFPKREIDFVFLKNRDFFEQFLSKDLSTNLFIPFKNRKVNERYVVFVPGAGANFRRWSPKNFVKVADFIIQEYNLRIKILGSKNDSKIAEEIIHHSRFPEKIENLTGNTLINSIDIIGNSKLLISNDTGMVHIAAATDTFTLCVSNGNQFGEFHPYPKKISKKIYYIYPPKIENEPFEELIKKYSRCSNLDINLITSEEVIKRFDTLLNSTK